MVHIRDGLIRFHEYPSKITRLIFCPPLAISIISQMSWFAKLSHDTAVCIVYTMHVPWMLKIVAVVILYSVEKFQRINRKICIQCWMNANLVSNESQNDEHRYASYAVKKIFHFFNTWHFVYRAIFSLFLLQSTFDVGNFIRVLDFIYGKCLEKTLNGPSEETFGVNKTTWTVTEQQWYGWREICLE